MRTSQSEQIQAEQIQAEQTQVEQIQAEQIQADQVQMKQSAERMWRQAWAATARALLMCENATASRLTAQRMSSRNRRRVEAARADVQRIMNASWRGR